MNEVSDILEKLWALNLDHVVDQILDSVDVETLLQLNLVSRCWHQELTVSTAWKQRLQTIAEIHEIVQTLMDKESQRLKETTSRLCEVHRQEDHPQEDRLHKDRPQEGCPHEDLPHEDHPHKSHPREDHPHESLPPYDAFFWRRLLNRVTEALGDWTHAKPKCLDLKEISRLSTTLQCASCFKRQGDDVITGQKDGGIRIWDRKTMTTRAKCQVLYNHLGDDHTTPVNGHTAPVLCVDAWGPYVFSGGEDAATKIWTTSDTDIPIDRDHHHDSDSSQRPMCKNLVLIDQSEHHTEKICTLKVKNLSGLGLRMVTGSEDKTAAILEIDVAMKMCKGRLLNGHEGAVLTADFDEQVTVTGSFDKTLRIWETSTGRHLDTIVRNFPVKCIRLRHPLLLEGSGHTIGLWHLEEMRQIRQVNNGDWVTALDCDWNKRLVTSAAWSAKSHALNSSGLVGMGLNVWNFRLVKDEDFEETEVKEESNFLMTKLRLQCSSIERIYHHIDEEDTCFRGPNLPRLNGLTMMSEEDGVEVVSMNDKGIMHQVKMMPKAIRSNF